LGEEKGKTGFKQKSREEGGETEEMISVGKQLLSEA